MSVTRPARLILALATLAALLVGALSVAAPRAVAEPQSWLTGQLLVATPAMGDPRFARTVILMVRHDKDGAFGLVVNRPALERPLAEVLGMLGDTAAPVAGTVRLFAGGPVQPQIGFVIHSTDYRAPQTIDVDGHVAVTSSRDILRDIGAGKGPRKRLIVFGYAGWAAGQLERELENRSWTTTPASEKLIFDEDREKLWEIAYAQRTQDL